MMKIKKVGDSQDGGDLDNEAQSPIPAKQSLIEPSPELQKLLKTFAKDSENLFDKWQNIKDLGAKEGFSENQLVQMVRPYLKKCGLSKSKIYYIFHKEEQKERVKRHKFNPNNDKNATVKSSANTKENGRTNLDTTNSPESPHFYPGGSSSKISGLKLEQQCSELKVNQNSDSLKDSEEGLENGTMVAVPIEETNRQAVVDESKGSRVSTYFDLINPTSINCENHPMYQILMERMQELKKVLEEKNILIGQLSKDNGYQKTRSKTPDDESRSKRKMEETETRTRID
jgi:hypothetical protein